MAGYLGASPVPQTIQKKQSFTATASQTTFTTTGYTDGAFINVYLNGVRLINGTDYTATNGSDIVLTTGASASDVLDFETFNEFTLVDQTLETPTFRTSATLKNDTEEDTDGGRESTLIFKGEQSGGEISTLAEIEASHDGTADDEKGDLIFRTNDGSDGASPTEAMRITSQQRLGIGTTAPSEQLHISNADDAIVLVESTGSDATDDANIQLKTTNGTFTIQNDRSIGTSGALTVAGNTSNNIVVDHNAGLVGIGRTPSSSTGSVLQLEGSDGMAMRRPSQTNSFTMRPLSSGDGMRFTQEGSGDRALFDNSGNFIVGDNEYPTMGTDTGTGSVMSANGQFRAVADGDVAGYFKRLSSNGTVLQFYRSQISVGRIDITTSATSYITSSDHRMKENVTDLSDGITRVKQLDPKRFNFISEPDSTVDGFLAHEVQTVVPEAISGTHNEVDDDGNPIMQGIDHGKLVPLLTAALQEAIAKIETLETKVAALEAE